MIKYKTKIVKIIIIYNIPLSTRQEISGILGLLGHSKMPALRGDAMAGEDGDETGDTSGKKRRENEKARGKIR